MPIVYAPRRRRNAGGQVLTVAALAGVLAGLFLGFPMGRAFGRSEGERARRRSLHGRTLAELRADVARNRERFGFPEPRAEARR